MYFLNNTTLGLGLLSYLWVEYEHAYTHGGEATTNQRMTKGQGREEDILQEKILIVKGEDCNNEKGEHSRIQGPLLYCVI